MARSRADGGAQAGVRARHGLPPRPQGMVACRARLQPSPRRHGVDRPPLAAGVRRGRPVVPGAAHRGGGAGGASRPDHQQPGAPRGSDPPGPRDGGAEAGGDPARGGRRDRGRAGLHGARGRQRPGQRPDARGRERRRLRGHRSEDLQHHGALGFLPLAPDAHRPRHPAQAPGPHHVPGGSGNTGHHRRAALHHRRLEDQHRLL